jgi:hypothetical protein
MPALSKTFNVPKPCKENCKLTTPLFLLLAICLFGRVAEAEYGGGSEVIASAQTSTYVFLTEQSKVVKVGGLAGVHETYPIEGQFRLTVDFDAGTAWFGQVDANLIDDSDLLYERSLGIIFNMAELLGTVLDDTIIEFVGKTTDGMESTILLTLTFRGDSTHLAGRTVPPPNSADFFIFELDAAAGKKYGGGTGEPNDPYLIYTAEQMNTIGAEPNNWDKHFKLMADIDLSVYAGTDFNIIGYCVDWGSSDNKPFAGVFDGNGHTISNYSYTSTDANNVGLFAYVDDPNAEIKDLGLVDPNIKAGKGNWIGSLVGQLSEGTITGCYAEGSTVSGTMYVGGLVGWHSYGSIVNCNSTGNVSGKWWSVGGLVGFNSGTITNCTSSAKVSGNNNVGGLAGDNLGTITSCYATSSVAGTEHVGGMVGENFGGQVTNCYSTSSVRGTTLIGGLVGKNVPISYLNQGGGYILVGGTITNSYSTGSVLGNENIGGLVGDNLKGEITDSFWDIETSGLTISAGGTGKTTAEMQAESTFTEAGWDFVDESENGTEDIWSICEGTNYPRLVRQIPAGDFVCPDGITIDDFLLFIEHWRDDNCDPSNDYCDGTDLDFSGTVDINDLEIFLENWLADVRSD